MKRAFVLFCTLIALLIGQSIFIVNHFNELHYVEKKGVPDTIIVPETIEKLLYDTVTIRDTIKEVEYIPQTIPADFDSALDVLGGKE